MGIIATLRWTVYGVVLLTISSLANARYPAIYFDDLPWLSDGNLSTFITSSSTDGFALCNGTQAWIMTYSLGNWKWVSVDLTGNCFKIVTVGNYNVFFVNRANLSFDIYPLNAANSMEIRRLDSSMLIGNATWGGIAYNSLLLVTKVETDQSQMSFFLADLSTFTWNNTFVPTPLLNNVQPSGFPFSSFFPLNREGTVVMALPATSALPSSPVLDLSTMTWLSPLSLPVIPGPIKATAVNAQSSVSEYTVILYSISKLYVSTLVFPSNLSLSSTYTPNWNTRQSVSQNMNATTACGYSNQPLNWFYLVYSDGTVFDFNLAEFSQPGATFTQDMYNGTAIRWMICDAEGDDVFGLTDTQLLMFGGNCTGALNCADGLPHTPTPTQPGTCGGPGQSPCKVSGQLTGGIIGIIAAMIVLAGLVLVGVIGVGIMFLVRFIRRRNAQQEAERVAMPTGYQNHDA